MKQKLATLFCAVLVVVAAAGCEKMTASDKSSTQETAAASAQAEFCTRGSFLAEAFFETGETSCLLLHSYGPYVSYYLENAAPFLSFWESAQAGTDCKVELLFLRADGAVSYQSLSVESGTPYARFLRLTQKTDGTVEATDYACYPVQEWTLTQNGNFYYRIFPAGDKHYADFQLIRTTAPDEALFAALDRYVLPIDYYYVNLLITDWEEPSFTGVSFNDLFDRLYALQTGTQPESSRYVKDEAGLFRIPAAEFEAVILPFFDFSPETLRASADFDAETESYPWRPIKTNDSERYDYPAVEPSVTQIRENTDGTKTLFISCLSTDVPTDCIFSHELTVRELAAGRFQYVSNEITAQTAYGLPNSAPRLAVK